MQPLVKYYKLRPEAKAPRYAKPGDAGADLFVCHPYRTMHLPIPPGGRLAVPTGLILEIPDGWCGVIREKSGLALHWGLGIGAGLIDSGFRGEVEVLIRNFDHEQHYIENGMKIAQICFVRADQAMFEEVDTVSHTERGADGWGSTG